MPLPNVMYRICLNLGSSPNSAYTADNQLPNNSAKKSQNIGSKNSAKASFPYLTTEWLWNLDFFSWNINKKSKLLPYTQEINYCIKTVFYTCYLDFLHNPMFIPSLTARDAFAECYVPNLLEFRVFSEFGKDCAEIPVPNNSAKKSQNIDSKNSAKASFPSLTSFLTIQWVSKFCI